MVKIIAAILFLVFLFLSLMHFYWAFGGKWGNTAVVPTKKDNVPLFKPRIISTIIVAIGLLSFGILYLVKFNFLEINLPIFINQYGLWIITIIFCIRAVGDFKYVGFFKKIKETKFAINDTKYYSPLCLLISLLTLFLMFA